MPQGVDAASRLSGAAVHAAGYSFVARYASHTPGKDLSAPEAQDLLAHNVDVVLVWESTLLRPLAGHDAGLQDGAAMGARMDALGCPKTMAGYFAVDFPAQTRDLPAINSYRDAFASQLRGRPDGVYGPSGVIDYLRARGCRYGWQAGATSWSGGKVTPNAQLLQIAKLVVVGGINCDLDRSLAADYGGWSAASAPQPPTPVPTPPSPGPTPPTPTEDDMPKSLKVQDPTSQGWWYCRTATGSIYTDAGAPYLGGLTDHADWGGAGTPADPVADFNIWRDEDGNWGYVIVTEETRDASGFHFYHFDRRGTYLPAAKRAELGLPG